MIPVCEKKKESFHFSMEVGHEITLISAGRLIECPIRIADKLFNLLLFTDCFSQRCLFGIEFFPFMIRVGF